MNPHEQLIEEFYAGFAAHDPETMASCYHPEVEFHDPVFGKLTGAEVADMWRMLISRSKGNLVIEFSAIHANDNQGSANWVATYNYSTNNNKVVNPVQSTFKFKDDLIIEQRDHFDLWQWSRQALGFKGALLGWSSVMKSQIQRKAKGALQKFRRAVK